MDASSRSRRITAVRRQEERVTPLELFFDLVFVLAITQCTALMAATPTWEGILQGLLVLIFLWWTWGGYAWLTSVVDPEEGSVRLAMFAAMAALLVAALAVPHAFGDDALAFALAYAFVRFAHIWLFVIASRDDPALRRSATGLGLSTGLGVSLLIVASATDGWLQIAIWLTALVLDAGLPFLFWAEGWRVTPSHFAERHGLILIIALGESIVAIGIGSNAVVDLGVVVAATLGVGIAAAMWWVYFDVTAWVAERRLSSLPPGKEQNELARDAYSYIHYLMIAGIVLFALGMKKALEDVGDPLKSVPAIALVGGVALYLAALVAFRLRMLRTLSRPRLVAVLGLCATVPLALELPAVGTVAVALGIVVGLVAYEFVRYGEFRGRIRHELVHGHGPAEAEHA